MKLITIRHFSQEFIAAQTITSLAPPQFQDTTIEDILINQTDLYIERRLTNPIEAAIRQAGLVKQIDEYLMEDPKTSIGYFGIAHIPLLFLLGYQATNKRPFHFFEYNRHEHYWQALTTESEFPELTLDSEFDSDVDEDGEVIIRVSISDFITEADVCAVTSGATASFHLSLDPPQRDVVTSEKQLVNYGRRFRELLDFVHNLVPHCPRIHLFYAGPVSLAVYFGQLLTKTIEQNVIVYNYTSKDEPRYSWALNVSSSAKSNDFLLTFSNREGDK